VKITFKNFKQHQDREFIFPDRGLVLLNGGSGQGKTTILKGILQALFGTVNKPYTFGTKVCSVDLELNNLKIMRQKGPNRLVVNGTEDATAQDIIEKTLGMNEAEFMASSYIQQKMQSSLLTLSPADQLSFIEKLAFGENSPDKFKAKINDLVLARKKDIEGVSKKTEMLNEMILPQELLIKDLESQLQPIEPVDESLASETRERFAFFKNQREEALEAIAKLTNEKNYPDYVILDNLEKARKHVESLESSETERLATLDSEVEKLGISWEEMSRNSAVDLLAQWRDYPNYCKVINELERNIKRLAEYNAQNDLAKRDIEKELNALPFTNLDELKLQLKQLKELEAWFLSRDKITVISNPLGEKYPDMWKSHVLKGVKKFEAIKADIETYIANKNNLLLDWNKKKVAYQEQITLLNQSEKILTCPDCHATLVLSEGMLKKEAYRNIEAEKFELQENLRVLNEIIANDTSLLMEYRIDLNAVMSLIKEIAAFPPKPNDLVNSLEIIPAVVADKENRISDAEATETSRQTLLNKLDLINKEQLSKRIEEEIEIKFKEQQRILKTWPNFEAGIGFSKDPVEQTDKAKWLENYLASNDDRDSSRRNLNMQKVNESLLLNNSKQKVTELEGRVANLVSVLRDRNVIDTEIKSSESVIIMAVSRIASLKPFMEKLELIEVQKKRNAEVDSKLEAAKSNLQNLRDQKDLVAQEVKTAEDKLEGVIRLKQFSETAQMEAVASVVESVNIAAREFLDLLFPENPILVSLLPFKQTKDAGVRAKFSTIIKYKGCEYNDIDEISGGEYDRIVLAYQLALNTLYSSPILLLDEAFTAVEEELFLLAMDALKVIAQNKLIVVVSHGAIQGLFDEVIEV
jgi:exonuclease SbcC